MATTFQTLIPADSSALTITLASLASSAAFATGRQSAEIDNTGNLDLDLQIGGKITVGTGPSAGSYINVYAVGCYKRVSGSSTYPDVITGAGDAAKTFTAVEILGASAVLLSSMLVNSTSSNIAYYFTSKSLAQAFGGLFVPPTVVLYVGHNTGVNLHATGGNHEIYYTRFRSQGV